jgi:ATP-dependent helicase/nuclease subunit A
VETENILKGLNEKQLEAVRVQTNAVVSAGAGSGKTSVIAARYAWLVMEKKIPVEEILTLTFTNKAVNEMYSRIYSILAARQDNPEARKAVAFFNRASILTLDSFCTGVARIAARRYGLNPDFICDPEGVQALAVKSALPFALNKRENRGLRILLGDKKIQTLAEELFAEMVLSAGSLAAPLDFLALWEKQRDEISRVWKKLSKDGAELAELMLPSLEAVKKPGDQFEEILGKGNPPPPVPDIPALLWEEDSGGALRREVRPFFAWLDLFCSIKFSGRLSPEKESIKETRDALKEIKERLESLALFALSAETIRDVFSLLEEYQRDFFQKKRELGILSFRDIAELAVDALTRFPDLRQFYKRSFSAIMIDEFQDNNALQRDLIFLLAEDEKYQEPGVPDIPKLNPRKVIFVGDEKQSIYRFRGADVSVFRKLSDSFLRGGDSEETKTAAISLDKNYRSRPILIRAFNYFFGGLLPSGESGGPSIFLKDQKNIPGFEARYEEIFSGLGEPEPDDIKNPPLHFCFLDADQIPRDDPSGLSGGDLEAASIAMKIREMVAQGYEIQTRSRDGTGKRRCEYGDVAVLLRTLGHQILLEKQFQNFGIPYSADEPAGLFSDAPINDLFSFLRILVYPHDKAAYAALIRSPFCGLSDMVLAVCMLDKSGIPFNEELEKDIPPEEREAFRKSRELYQSLVREAGVRPTADLLTRLWYEEGYRYETLWSPSAQIYGELFDFFFELARRSEQRGQTLAEFLDDFAELVKNEERIKELRIPAEREGGVRIMTIHKSKGLEFPVVFIPECQSTIRPDRRGDTVFFSENWGLSFKLPGVEELPGEDIENYFFLLSRDETKQKAAAELRRLLYVAMTRAESALFLSAVLPPRTKDEREAREKEEKKPEAPWILERLIELREKKQDSGALPGFLDLLLPVLTAADNSLYTLETIPVYSRAELSRFYAAGRRGKNPPAMEKAAEAAAAFYEKAPVVSPPRPPAPGFNASALRYAPPESSSPAETSAPPPAPDDIDAILRAAKLEPAEFGTIVHAYLESPGPGGKNRIPPRFLARLSGGSAAAIDAAARGMAEKFLASDLGRRSMADPHREPEYPILTMIKKGEEKIPLRGTIDLLFESEGAVWVVDFKTDKTEEPERHLAQLAVYRRAVSDIFGKPVRAWLFFLRSGKARELTADLENVDIEELIAGLMEQAPEAPKPEAGAPPV